MEEMITLYLLFICIPYMFLGVIFFLPYVHTLYVTDGFCSFEIAQVFVLWGLAFLLLDLVVVFFWRTIPPCTI